MHPDSPGTYLAPMEALPLPAASWRPQHLLHFVLRVRLLAHDEN
jgi:hypothetical protein